VTVKLSARAALFDLDGVLVDSIPCVERHWRMWAERHNVPFEAIVRIMHGRRTAEAIAIVAPHLDAEREGREFDEREGLDLDGIGAAPGASALPAALPAGAWAIVTSGTQGIATGRLRHSGLPIPRVLVTGEQLVRGKPDPEGYLKAAAALGVAPEDCVVFEDAPPGIQAGRAAGMKVVAIASTHVPDELRLADVCVQRLSDVSVVNVDPEATRATFILEV
jgi:sugar-phosphatase